MSARRLYLAAYDITDPKRLRRALDVVRDYATGGQKSVHECFLTDHERNELLERMDDIITTEDRFFLLRVTPRRKPRALGQARLPTEPRYFYVG